MALIIVEKANTEDIGQRYSIGEKTVLIGRVTPEKHPDITFRDESISRCHAEICYQDNGFYLRDLHSTNGTILDQQRIEPGKLYRLKQDSVIGLAITHGGARVLLRFKENPSGTTTRLEETVPGESLPVSWLKINEDTGEIWVDGKRLTLPRKEYDLLLFLHNNAGKVCQKDELISRVWPEAINGNGVSDAAIDQLVHRLRLKIEPDPSQPKRLISRKGFGYILV